MTPGMQRTMRGSMLSVAASLVACAQMPAPPDPALQLPASYRHGCNVESRAAEEAQLDAWWRGFGDETLTRVVERVLTGNLSLAQADARLAQARAAARAAGARLLPHGELQASSARVSQSLLDPLSGLVSQLPGFEREYTQNRLGAAASWEIDLGGGSKAARDAAVAEAAASGNSMLAVRVSVAAEASDGYLRLRTAQARLAIALRQEAVERRLVDLVSQRVAEGLTARRELYSAEAALEGVLAGMPPLWAAIEAEVARLDVLMGAAPGTHRSEFERESPLPRSPGIAAAQGPAALLRRRPDVVAAELRLAASHSRIAQSMAEYYPKVSLSALLGWNSGVAGRLISSDAREAQVGAALRWRLFDFGRVDAEVAAARGQEAEALAAYRATVFNAAAEVETAFSALLQDEARAAALDRQIDRLQSARELAFSAYGAGAISLLEVLDLDRQLLSASDQRTLARSGAARAAVASFRALGGGWQIPAQAPAGMASAKACTPG